MVTKDEYNCWNVLKQEIQFWKSKNKYPKPGEVWNVYNGLNIGYESKWKWVAFERPFLVLKRVWVMFLCVSMITRWKEGSKFYFKLDHKYFKKDSYVTLSQWKCIDNKRFIKKVCSISHNDLYKIKKDLYTLWF
jgi:hypothetical protein